ncbi:MAG: hydrolase TatD [Myxococcales bacterium]|nr:hydrolase TatD [Myxococcales bacterium]
MSRLIDIGVNLCDKSFAKDRPAVIRDAAEVGIDRMVVTGTSLAGSEAAATLASEHCGTLWSTAGIHPHHAKDFDDSSIDTLRNLAQRPEVVAIGECGLDYNRNFSTPVDQRRCFEAQVELASEMQMPLFLHERDAKDDQLAILGRQRASFSRAVVHCFTGDAETLRAYLDLDLYIGITGWICDERRGLHLRELLREIPLGRLMLETDAPYLMPRTIRPKPKSRRNVPAHLPYVLNTVAECLDLPENEIAAATTATAIEFFGL